MSLVGTQVTAGHSGSQIGVEAGGGERAAGHFRIDGGYRAGATGNIEFIGGEIEAGDRVVMRARRLRRRGVDKDVCPRPAGQIVRAQAAKDDEAPVGLCRAVEGQHVACGQCQALDHQCLARSHRRVVGRQVVAVTRREIQRLHIDQRRGVHHQSVRTGVVAAQLHCVDARPAVDLVGGGQIGSHVDVVVAGAGIDRVVASAGPDGVVTCAAVDRVVAAASGDRVVAIVADNGVVSGSAD